jgi:hypothetical protein
VADDGVKVERAVRLVPVQKHGHRDDRNVGQQQSDCHMSPPRQLEDSRQHETPSLAYWPAGECNSLTEVNERHDLCRHIDPKKAGARATGINARRSCDGSERR